MRVLVIHLWLLLTVSPATADVLDIILRRDGAPKQYLDENGNTMGYAAEIVIRAAEKAGFEPRITHVPWKRAQVLALEGKGILTGFSWTPERAMQYYFTEPLYDDRVLLVQERSNTFEFKDFGDLEGKLIGITRGSTYAGEFSEIRDLLNLQEDPGNPNRLMQLSLGRIDAGIFSGGIFTIAYHARKLGLDPERFVVADKPISIDPNFIGVPKDLLNHDAGRVRDKLNAALLDMKKNGTIEQILDGYRFSKHSRRQ